MIPCRPAVFGRQTRYSRFKSIANRRAFLVSRSLMTLRITLPLACLFFSLPSAAADFPLGPDSQEQPGVPKGKVTKHVFDQSLIFPGTWREYWVYVPAQHDGSQPHPLMVFQDGLQYQAPIVFDNLIHQKVIPPLIGVFVMHGRVRARDDSGQDRFNRSFEYDGLGDRYARFLLEELLPHIAREHGLNLSADGNDRAIAGNSSGAICAFTAAWERPDAFRRVFSAIGTYVGLRGGNDYPTLIRKTEPKPIRVFLQDGSNDLNIYGGDWWMANQEMLSALEFAGYDVSHVWGEGGHDSRHATAIFPAALRWLWRDWPAGIKANPEFKSRQPVVQIVNPEQGWEVVSEGHQFTEGPAVNARGELFFTDLRASTIHKVGLDGTVTLFAEDTGSANGLMFGPDGKLYACANGRRQIVAYDENGRVEIVAEEVNSNDLAVNHLGDLWFSDHGNEKIWYLPKDGKPRVVDTGIERPNGVVLTTDQQFLLVSDTAGRFVYSLQIQPDGSLTHKQKFFHLHTADGSNRSQADGMTVDEEGRLYVTTEMGVQVCDQPGRVQAIISKPQNAWLSNVLLGGPNRDVLYVTCGDKVYRRPAKTKGVLSWHEPVKPPRPRL